MNLDFLKDKSISDILILGFIIGLIYNIIMDIIYSLCDYLSNKGYRSYKYEHIILKLFNNSDSIKSINLLSYEERELIYRIKDKYYKKEKRYKKLNNLFKKKK